MLDLFPAIEVARRTFSNGSGSTAEVTVATDGSGSLQATGLVEQASMQVSNPDPTPASILRCSGRATSRNSEFNLRGDIP